MQQALHQKSTYVALLLLLVLHSSIAQGCHHEGQRKLLQEFLPPGSAPAASPSSIFLPGSTTPPPPAPPPAPAPVPVPGIYLPFYSSTLAGQPPPPPPPPPPPLNSTPPAQPAPAAAQPVPQPVNNASTPQAPAPAVAVTPTPSTAPAPPPTAPVSPPAPGSSGPPIVAIVVPVVVGSCLIAAAVLALLLMRRRRHRQGHQQQHMHGKGRSGGHPPPAGWESFFDEVEDGNGAPVQHTAAPSYPAIGSFDAWQPQQQHQQQQQGSVDSAAHCSQQTSSTKPFAAAAASGTRSAAITDSSELSTVDGPIPRSAAAAVLRGSLDSEAGAHNAVGPPHVSLSALAAAPAGAGESAAAGWGRAIASSAAAPNALTVGSSGQQPHQVVLDRQPSPQSLLMPRNFTSPFAKPGMGLLPSLESAEHHSIMTNTSDNAVSGREGREVVPAGAGTAAVPVPTGAAGVVSRTVTPTQPRTPQTQDSLTGALNQHKADDRPSKSGVTGSSRLSWVMGGAAAASSSAPASSFYLAAAGDAGQSQQSGLSGLTGMSGSSTTSGGGVPIYSSVAARPSRVLSGTPVDHNWDFDRARHKPVRVLMQVDEDPGIAQPVTLLLLVSAPPPKPELSAQVVLPSDPILSDVDLSIDANSDLALPSNSFIGKGAFGQVHRALYRGRLPVAVKMLTDPELRQVDAETLRSFHEELAIMARLQHPHIVRCYGGNLDCPNPFIITELCECSLDKVIGHFKHSQGTGLPLRITLNIGLHIASALWHLHPSIVHRDLKPQNVLLDSAGTAKVADFGLSRMKTHTFVSTRHVEAGTAAYMAPECFVGEGVTEKVDIYALAMLLWECVMGERPWKHHNMVQVAYQVAMSNNRPPLPPISPSCPAELAQLIADCWASNPRERPSSGEVMKSLAQMTRVHLPPS